MTARATHTHAHAQFTAPAAHIQAEKKRRKTKENERPLLAEIVGSMKNKERKTNLGIQRDSRMIRGTKRKRKRRKPPARLTKKKPSSYMSGEKDRSQRKKRPYDQRYHFALILLNRSRI